MVEIQKLQDLAQSYEISFDLVKEYNDRLLICPLLQGDEESLLECLEEFISERKSLNQRKERMSLEDTFSNVIYRKYGDRAVPYLSTTYKELYHISDDNEYLAELMNEESTFDEEMYDYHGFKR